MGRVAGQQAAGLNAVTLELLQNFRPPRAARQGFSVGMCDRTFAGARVERRVPRVIHRACGLVAGSAQLLEQAAMDQSVSASCWVRRRMLAAIVFSGAENSTVGP